MNLEPVVPGDAEDLRQEYSWTDLEDAEGGDDANVDEPEDAGDTVDATVAGAA